MGLLGFPLGHPVGARRQAEAAAVRTLRTLHCTISIRSRLARSSAAIARLMVTACYVKGPWRRAFRLPTGAPQCCDCPSHGDGLLRKGAMAQSVSIADRRAAAAAPPHTLLPSLASPGSQGGEESEESKGCPHARARPGGRELTEEDRAYRGLLRQPC